STPAAASWPGSNGDIFMVENEGNETSIVRYNQAGEVVGSVAENLTQFSNFSTDAAGERLVYSSNGELVLVDLESMEPTNLTESPAIETDPTFSFDGRYVVYVSNGDGDQDIYMWDLTDPSMGPYNLTNNDVDDWAPAWGNDGTGHGDLIAYVSLQNSAAQGESDIWTMTPGGTDKTDLTNNDVPDFGPNWHPSFDMLAYSSQDEAGRDQIHTMSWDGSGKDQLTSDDNYNYEPAWSPDGTKIAFTKQSPAVNSVGRIYIRSGSPGGTETPLTPAGPGTDRADWQAAPGGCEPNCGGEPIRPTILFSLKRHVVVSGSVIGQGSDTEAGGTCGVGTPVNIQRKIDGKFKTIASLATDVDGKFSRKVPDRTGQYRVVSTRYTDAETGTECLPSQAAAKTHRHRR
ncbi:MAG TPA: hypothetical protein VEV43_08785, partial [Actinomycetota bacterium]|nr:hypothetical protein [Actinomycetota bacterium]